jgi:hypothetical protein
MYGTVETINQLFSDFFGTVPGGVALLFCHPEPVEGSLIISALGARTMLLPRGGVRDPSKGSG